MIFYHKEVEMKRTVQVFKEDPCTSLCMFVLLPLFLAGVLFFSLWVCYFPK